VIAFGTAQPNLRALQRLLSTIRTLAISTLAEGPKSKSGVHPISSGATNESDTTTKSLQNPKVLNSTEDAHTETMSTFRTDEHLRRVTRQLRPTPWWLKRQLALPLKASSSKVLAGMTKQRPQRGAHSGAACC
jgi:hypothetical protein